MTNGITKQVTLRSGDEGLHFLPPWEQNYIFAATRNTCESCINVALRVGWDDWKTGDEKSFTKTGCMRSATFAQSVSGS